MPNKDKQLNITISGNKLFDRVVSILEQARTNVVKAVNSNMIIAYWLIGREILLEIQQSKNRAAYGKKVLDSLSNSLNKRYGSGFSTTNLKYFRLFYQVYADRDPVIRHKPCDEFGRTSTPHKPSAELSDKQEIQKRHKVCDVFGDLNVAIEKRSEVKGFSPSLKLVPLPHPYQSRTSQRTSFL